MTEISCSVQLVLDWEGSCVGDPPAGDQDQEQEQDQEQDQEPEMVM